jgi:hypothetical protein
MNLELDPETESVLDEARAIRQHLGVMLVALALSHRNPRRFAEGMRAIGRLLRHTGEDLIDHADRLDQDPKPRW